MSLEIRPGGKQTPPNKGSACLRASLLCNRAVEGRGCNIKPLFDDVIDAQGWETKGLDFYPKSRDFKKVTLSFWAGEGTNGSTIGKTSFNRKENIKSIYK